MFANFVKIGVGEFAKMDPFTNSCSDSLNCEARTESFKSATSEDPLADLIGEWGYTGLLPENAVRWQRLPNYVHYVIGGLIIFMGKSSLIRAFNRP